MKRLLLKLASIAVLLLSFGTAHAQSPLSDEQRKLIEQIKKKMDETELGLITESDITFGEAKAILESVSAEDIEVEKAFMKGSTPKAEKRAVNVKRNRIEAAKLYEKGYNMVFEACESRLKQIKFSDETKQTKAKDISNQASETMTNAVTKGDDYKYLKDKDLETLRYDDLKSRIEGANKLFIDGLILEFDAWKVYLGEFAIEPEAKPKTDSIQIVDTTTKKEIAQAEPTKPAEDSTIKSSIKTETTLPVQVKDSGISPETTLPVKSTESGLTPETMVKNEVLSEKSKEITPSKNKETVTTVSEEKAPKKVVPATKQSKPLATKQTKNGKSAKTTSVVKSENTEITSSAATTKTEKKSNKKAGSGEALESSTTLKGTVYLVQVLAIQRGKLSGVAKKQLYSGSKKMYEDYENDLYKYRIGDFASEDEAFKFKQDFGKGSFVLKLIDGVRQMDYIKK